jgi:Uri superfamily endonuclease
MSAAPSGRQAARPESHHLQLAPRPGWHIDYLRQHAEIEQIWYTIHIPYEHEWAEAFRRTPGSATPIPRFGSSGCY